jgi:hypothetical protein
MFSGTMSILALLFSIASFAYVNYDRRVKLLLRARKGDWYVLDRATDSRETIFRGIIEVYNDSSRPNAVCGYRFWIDNNGIHEDLESEMASIGEHSEGLAPDEQETSDLFNVTPLPIPAYTGVEARIYAIVKGVHTLQGNHLPIMVEIEDIHGRRYTAQVSASRTERLISGRNVVS